MSVFQYITVDIFSAALLLIIFLNSRTKHSRSLQNKLLHIGIILTFAILVVDILTYVLDGKIGMHHTVLLYIFNIAYFVLTAFIAYFWLLFAQCSLYGKICGNKLQKIIIVVPAVAFCVLAIITPFCHTIFYIDEANKYCRSSLFYLQSLIGLGYLISATIIALIKRRKENVPERRRECLFIAVFSLLPLFAGFIQSLSYGLTITWPTAALSLLMVYINIQNHQISIDSLTKLHNRGELDKFLLTNCVDNEKSKTLSLLLLDIDRFKSINDTYGHIEGDKVLKRVASILKGTFLGEKAFIARYGGDEFAIAIFASQETVEYKIEEIQDEISLANFMYDSKYKVSLSIGYAQYASDDITSIEQFIALADKRMYAEKKSKRTTV